MRHIQAISTQHHIDIDIARWRRCVSRGEIREKAIWSKHYESYWGTEIGDCYTQRNIEELAEMPVEWFTLHNERHMRAPSRL